MNNSILSGTRNQDGQCRLRKNASGLLKVWEIPWITLGSNSCGETRQKKKKEKHTDGKKYFYYWRVKATTD